MKVRRQLGERTARAQRPRGRAGREWWEDYLQREPYEPSRCKFHPRTVAGVVMNGVPLCGPCQLKADPPRINGPDLPDHQNEDYLKACERAAAAVRRLKKDDEEAAA